MKKCIKYSYSIQHILTLEQLNVLYIFINFWSLHWTVQHVLVLNFIWANNIYFLCSINWGFFLISQFCLSVSTTIIIDCKSQNWCKSEFSQVEKTKRHFKTTQESRLLPWLFTNVKLRSNPSRFCRKTSLLIHIFLPGTWCYGKIIFKLENSLLYLEKIFLVSNSKLGVFKSLSASALIFTIIANYEVCCSGRNKNRHVTYLK